MLIGIRNFLKLIRYEDHTTSLQLLLGYVLSKGFNLVPNDYAFLIMLFFIFGPLLYGGIYIFNDIMDLKYDQKHPIKKNRVLASGGLKIKTAKIVSLCLIIISLIVGFILSADLFLILVLFLLINILYTLVLKHVPYVEIFANTVTHTLRVISGMALAGNIVFLNFLLVHFLALLAISTFKRYREIRNGNLVSRKVLSKYSLGTLNIIQNMLLFMAGIVLIASFGKVDFILGLLPILFALLPILGYYRNDAVKRFIDFCWR